MASLNRSQKLKLILSLQQKHYLYLAADEPVISKSIAPGVIAAVKVPFL